MQRIYKPNYTIIPNIILDKMMSEMSESEFRVVIAICRKTFGWHKDKDRISISQIEKLTGLSHNAVIEGTKQALERGIVERHPISQSFEYEISVFEEVETSNLGLPVILDYELEPKPVILDYQQKKGLKDIDASASTTLPPQGSKPEPLKSIDSQVPTNGNGNHKILTSQQAMVGALAMVCELDIRLEKGKLVTNAARLIKAGYTHEQINNFYGKGGEYYKRDWRGKQGQLPNIATINDTIAQAVKGNWGIPSWTKESQSKFPEEQRAMMREVLVKASHCVAETPEAKDILENKACGLLEIGYIPKDVSEVYNIPNGIYCRRCRNHNSGDLPPRLTLEKVVSRIGEFKPPNSNSEKVTL